MKYCEAEENGESLPDGWKNVQLGEVAEINPRRPSGLHRADGRPTSFVPMAAVDEQHGVIASVEAKPYGEVKKGYTYFAEGDVLFAKITPCMQNGKHAIARELIDGIGYGTTEFHVIRPGTDLVAEWAHFYIRQPQILRDAMAHFTGAVGQQRVPKNFLADLEIPLPPVAEQKRIAGILKEQLAAVERARAAAEAQLEAAKALPAAYLRGVFAQLQHCKTVKLSAIASRGITYGIVLTGDHCPDGVPTVRGGDVKGFAIERESLKRVERHISEQFSRTLLRGDEVLLVIRGHPGNVAVVAPDLVGCNVAREIAVIAVTENWSRPYIQYAIASPTVQQSILGKTRGAAQKGINLSDVANLEIPDISVSEQTSVTNRLSEWLDGTGNVLAGIKAQLRTIEALPSALLRAAFQGRL